MRILRTSPLLLALPLLALPLRGLAAPASPSALEQAPVLLPYETTSPAATHPSLHSFGDVYRLAEAHPRIVSQASAEAGPEPRFSVSAPRDASRWPLVFAGLFACAWVAHRRLTSPY